MGFGDCSVPFCGYIELSGVPNICACTSYFSVQICLFPTEMGAGWPARIALIREGEQIFADPSKIFNLGVKNDNI